MDPQLEKKLLDLETRINAVHASTEKTRKYFLAVLIISVVAFVLPLIGLVFVIPQFLNMYASYGAI